ncbi:MAG: threonine--tRNA ligase [Candidatus Nanohaloarchaeota archaeon QJJ-9]|nr:threonine--tRNA ligase [Candidatus Nanohaloarchaeota archaeon QJJ-9]
MRLLMLHSDHLEFEPHKKAVDQADEKGGKQRVEECLVVFNSLEKGDEKDLDSVVSQAVQEVRDTADKVSVENVVVYPYVHLTDQPGDAGKAQEVQKRLVEKLEADFSVTKAPFGWYKEFEIHVKGHPLSELSKQISPGEEDEKTRDEVVEDIESDYYILTPDGEEKKIDPENSSALQKVEDDSLKQFIESEEVKGQPKEKPPSIDAMQRLELVDYEPASDSGNFRFYPKGSLLFDLLKEWADEIAIDRLDSMEIDTPLLYDWSQEDIREQGGSFHERHYTVSVPDDETKEFVLRFAGDFGLFRIMKDANLSYRNLPMNVYEFSKSFRYEKKGELSGLRRLRAFHMPDIHSFTENVGQGWDVYEDIYKRYNDLAEATGVEFAVAFRVVEEFYEENKDKIVEMLEYSDKPALIEVISDMKHYWAVKHEFQGIDSVGGNLQLSTVQLDVEDAERYDITYTDKENEDKGCIICHSSIGSIERWIYAIIEQALKKDKPMLPVWLSPGQVRVLPISDEQEDYAEQVADQLNARVEIDDRDESVGRKIRDAEKDWIPYTVVVGSDEVEEGNLTVRLREKGSKEVEMDVEDLNHRLGQKLSGKPFKQLSLPRKLSRRPNFRG